MKIIITENQLNMLKFQRRLNFVQEYIDKLPEDSSIDDICNHWTEDESDAFVNNTMWDLVTQICDEIGNMDSYDEIYEYIVDNGYRKQIEDFFFDTLDNYCKRGKQKKHVIEQIMEQNDITYEIYYKKRNYHNGEQYDSVDIRFYIDRGNGRKPEGLQSVYFKTIGNKIKPNTEPIVHGDFHWIFEVFRYLPSDVLTGYFTDKAKEYIEKILPLEYPR